MIYAIIICFLIVCAVYIALVNRDARMEVGSSPRTEMYICDKHGAFPKKYTHQITEVTDEPIYVCPFCFEDRFKEAAAKFK